MEYERYLSFREIYQRRNFTLLGKYLPRSNHSQFRMAAEQGDTDAKHIMGVLYATGHGVPYDYQLAYVWFSATVIIRSPEKKSGGTGRWRDDMRDKLNSNQLLKAADMRNELLRKIPIK